MKQYRKYGALAAVILMLSLGGGVVYAQSEDSGSSNLGSDHENGGKIEQATHDLETASPRATFGTDPSESPSEKPDDKGKNEDRSNKGALSTGQERACKVHEMNLKDRSDALTKRADRMEAKFDSIAGQVEDFATKNNVTVPNYTALVADITTKKAAVSTAIDTAKADLANFSCDSGDPKAVMTTFRQDMQAVNQALKDYRTSIKNLIVAIRTAAGDTGNDSSPSPTASPSATPSPVTE